MANELQTRESLRNKKCVPCEGGVPRLTREEAEAQLRELDGWQLSQDARKISKSWTLKNFRAAMQFFQEIAEVAEADNHHPDLHLERYRSVTIVLMTHAIDGLSENDMILAAKIDGIPVELKG